MLGIGILRGKVASEVNKLGVAMVCNLARQSSETSKQVRHRHDYLDRRSPYMFGPRTEDRGPRTEDPNSWPWTEDRGPRTGILGPTTMRQADAARVASVIDALYTAWTSEPRTPGLGPLG